MANQVYANGREISCKAADGKSICAFPDVCLTPPPPPAGYIPIPYPNTGFATDTTNGSRTVQISGQEVMLKNKSYFKKSTGDEAATRSTPMGVLTHTITGKVYFTSWSMDVKIEGENVVRMADLTTHNHMSVPGNTPTWPYVDEMAFPTAGACIEDRKEEGDACKEHKPYKQDGPDACPALKPPSPRLAHLRALTGENRTSAEGVEYSQLENQYYSDLATEISGSKCLRARRCMLVPYEPRGRGEKRQPGCCPGQTGHHLVEASAFHDRGRGDEWGSRPIFGCREYDAGRAPCLCVEGPNHGTGTHGLMHSFQSDVANNCADKTFFAGPTPFRAPGTTLGDAQKSGAQAAKDTFPESGCSAACLEAQLAAYHEGACKMGKEQPIKAVSTTSSPDVPGAKAEVQARLDALNAAKASGGSAS